MLQMARVEQAVYLTGYKKNFGNSWHRGVPAVRKRHISELKLPEALLHASALIQCQHYCILSVLFSYQKGKYWLNLWSTLNWDSANTELWLRDIGWPNKSPSFIKSNDCLFAVQALTSSLCLLYSYSKCNSPCRPKLSQLRKSPVHDIALLIQCLPAVILSLTWQSQQ